MGQTQNLAVSNSSSNADDNNQDDQTQNNTFYKPITDRTSGIEGDSNENITITEETNRDKLTPKQTTFECSTQICEPKVNKEVKNIQVVTRTSK